MADEEISIPTDDDGFIVCQCPFCEDRFKLQASDFNKSHDTYLFFPYCGLQHRKTHFLSVETVEQAHLAMENLIKQELNNLFGQLGRQTKGNFISIQVNKRFDEEPLKTLQVKDTELETLEHKCCGHVSKVRLLSKEIAVYCPFCGVN